MTATRIFPGQKTEAEQAEIDARMDAVVAEIKARARAEKKATGLMHSQRIASRRSWQYANSNFGMGM